MSFFTEIEKSHKIHKETQRLCVPKAILIKKSYVGAITISDFNLYCRVLVIKMVWYWHKNRHTDHHLEDADIRRHSYNHLILTEVAKTYTGEKTASLTCSAENTG
jgi:hypothetical protein